MRLEKQTEAKGYVKNKSHHSSNLTDRGNDDRLVCVNCGKAIKIDYPLKDLSQNVSEPNSGFYPQYHRMVIYGYCQNCRAN